ncbi:MAG TPA: glycosyltransferase [Candidatus Binatia bacterium]|nr:glycosyltransferase [Candidatus Binatia bacterium]
MRVHLGCGAVHLEGWVNVDSDRTSRADVHQDPVAFVRGQADGIDEVLLGAAVERLAPDDAVDLLIGLGLLLRPGTPVSAVAQDARAVCRAYLDGDLDNAGLNLSLIEPSDAATPKRWNHDAESLRRLFERAGLSDIQPADPSGWPELAVAGAPLIAVSARVPARAGTQPEAGEPAEAAGSVAQASEPAAAANLPPSAEALERATRGALPGPGSPGGPSAEDALLAEMRRLRAELRRARELLGDPEAHRLDMRPAREAEETRRAIAAIHGSATFRAASAASQMARRLLPAGSRRGRAARRMLGRRPQPSAPPASPPPNPFDRPGGQNPVEALRQRVASRAVTRPQRFHLLVLASGSGDLGSTLDSLRYQTWHHWRATVFHGSAGAGGADAVPGDAAAGAARSGPDPKEPRIVHHQGGTPAAINAVLSVIPAREMAIFLRPGDTLVPGCLWQIAARARCDPAVDLISWDDELVGLGGARRRLRLRPSWSPETLLSANYLDRAFALRAGRIRSAGGLRSEAGTAWLWDLLLRCDLDPAAAVRIPRVLTRSRRAARPRPDDAARVVTGALRRRGLPGAARWADGAVRVDWSPPAWPRLSVVIPTRHNRPLLGPLLDGLASADYPDLEVVVVDNGPRTPENERWYGERAHPPTVLWWDRPFNYSAVNNAGAKAASGELLLFLNDDIRVAGDPGWLRELAGWAMVEQVGSVGMQLVNSRGRIQHGGVVLGVTGFAGHLFAGLRPGASTLLGPTTWYRDLLAVTAACVAVRREELEAVGGFDEKFQLCGSDVVLGLALHARGRRNLCIPSNALVHREGATRGSRVPEADYFASWWRYQRWLRAGDPHFHPRLSLRTGIPRLRRPGEPSAMAMVGPLLGRQMEVWQSQSELARAGELAQQCRISPADVEAVRARHRADTSPRPPRTVNWFIPGIDSPFYGGINTAFRIAARLATAHGVRNRFVVCGLGPEEFISSGITVAFPELAGAEVWIADTDERVALAPPADAAIATLWTTAYQVALYPGAPRKYYLVQDFEPMFYPAGTLYALAEESYRLGLYGICNTDNLARLYRSYGGTACHFTPAVDPAVFHARGRRPRRPEDPVTLFVYARPGHWRNCWELALPALEELKDRLGDRIRILAAGSWAGGEARDRPAAVRQLGLLDYAETGDLYRTCDMGLALTVSEHPSYLPLELMACGAAVVAFDNPAGHWLLRDGVNCLLAPRTVDGLVDRLETLALDPVLRRRLARRGLEEIAERHSDWDEALSGIHGFLTDPEGTGTADLVGGAGFAGAPGPAEGAPGSGAPTGLSRGIRRPLPPAWADRAGESDPDGRSSEYREWLAGHRPTGGELLRMRSASQGWRERPLVSVIMPVYNPEPGCLEEAVQSVLDQTYERWELCMVDDGSTREGTPELLHRLATRDPRIRLQLRERNGGISAASNSALSAAAGDFVTLLDHDDFLEPHALHALLEPLQDQAELDFVYSDEDKLSPAGERANPFFKPDWSPELLLSLNYVTHTVLIRRSLVEEVGGFRSHTDGAQDYDLFLRCTERARGIAHVPQVLYTWRQVPGSAALSQQAKPWAYAAGLTAVRDAVARRGMDATVESARVSGWYRVRRRVPPDTGVTVLVQGGTQPVQVRRTVESIRSAGTEAVRGVTLLIGEGMADELADLAGGERVRVLSVAGSCGRSRALNLGLESAESPFVILVAGDLLVRSSDWVEALLEEALSADVVAVGGLLVDPDGNPLHQGISLGNGPGAGPASLRMPHSWLDLIPAWPVAREVSAVSAACMLVRVDGWRGLGGFDESFRLSHHDVDLCLRARAAGHRVIYTPHAELATQERSVPGELGAGDDAARFAARWAADLQGADPYAIPHVRWVEGRYRLV